MRHMYVRGYGEVCGTSCIYLRAGSKLEGVERKKAHFEVGHARPDSGHVTHGAPDTRNIDT